MAKINEPAAKEAAKRYARWKARQKTANDDAATAEMERRRLDFMLAGDHIFFETIVDNSDLLPMRHFALGQLAANAVGRIHLPPIGERGGDGFATGFLVAPNLLLTNNHVLPGEDWARAATLTMDAEDGLDGIPKVPRIFLFNPRQLFITDSELDFSLVAVTPAATDGSPLSSYGYLKLFADTGKIVQAEYATIVQHPNGRQKHIAYRNNEIDVYVYDQNLTEAERAENNFLYYKTDTLKGSSGSPVFSDQWFVVALHRRGVPKTRRAGERLIVLTKKDRAAREDAREEDIAFVANEGVRISRILKKLQDLAADDKDGRAGAAAQALRKIADAAGTIDGGPLSKRTATYVALSGASVQSRRPASPVMLDATLEVSRRPLAKFPEDLGYDPAFVPGRNLPLPKPSAALMREAARRLDKPDQVLLPFRHFTTMMHARRRLPIFAAVNISGDQRLVGRMPDRPGWSYDPRIDESHQPDDTIFSQEVQRGHMAAREYVYWGDEPEQKQADVHSFTLTNVCPQIAEFNGRKEWYEVERNVVKGAKAETLRLTEFLGPILRSEDPDYDSLRGPKSTAAFGTRIRIPVRFWKIVAWADEDGFKYRAMILDQRDELKRAGDLEMDLDLPPGVSDATIEEISELTDLEFEGFD